MRAVPRSAGGIRLFDAYVWRFVGSEPIRNTFTQLSDIPAISPEAETMSKDLRKRGFSFVGPTICYAHMQATGMVNDHLVTCFRHLKCELPYPVSLCFPL